MRKVREVATLLLDPTIREFQATEQTSPLVWCAKAGVSLSEWASWNAEYGEAFRLWFFGEMTADTAPARIARRILFYRTLDRAMGQAAPNATILRLYAEMEGLIGKNAIVNLGEGDGGEEDEEAWDLIRKLPLAVHRALGQEAERLEAIRKEVRPDRTLDEGQKDPTATLEPDVSGDEWDAPDEVDADKDE